jgi:hypothetical protein
MNITHRAITQTANPEQSNSAAELVQLVKEAHKTAQECAEGQKSLGEAMDRVAESNRQVRASLKGAAEAAGLDTTQLK